MVILPKKLHDSTSLSCQSCISYHVCRLLKDTHKDLKQAPRVCSRLSSKLLNSWLNILMLMTQFLFFIPLVILPLFLFIFMSFVIIIKNNISHVITKKATDIEEQPPNTSHANN